MPRRFKVGIREYFEHPTAHRGTGNLIALDHDGVRILVNADDALEIRPKYDPPCTGSIVLVFTAAYAQGAETAQAYRTINDGGQCVQTGSQTPIDWDQICALGEPLVIYSPQAGPPTVGTRNRDAIPAYAARLSRANFAALVRAAWAHTS